MTLGAAQGVAATGTHSGTFGGSAANDPRAQNTYGIAGGEGRPGPTGGGTYIPGGSTTTKNINWNAAEKSILDRSDAISGRELSRDEVILELSKNKLFSDEDIESITNI